LIHYKASISNKVNIKEQINFSTIFEAGKFFMQVNDNISEDFNGKNN